MKVYQLHRIQKLPISLDTAWDFLSDPANLKIITPDYMSFDIISGAEQKMYPGQIIQYTVSPILGLKMNWVTEITHVVEKQYFVDEQRFGPYKLWHHKHFLEATEEGVRIEDLIHYGLPFGIFGQIFHPLLVRNKLEEIFDYRKIALEDKFGYS